MRIFAFDQIQLFMRQWKLWMLAAILSCGFLTTSCDDGISEFDNHSVPSQQEIEKSLAGLWFEEVAYSGKLEDTGEPFTSVVLAMQVNADHTGCLYAGASSIMAGTRWSARASVHTMSR